MIMIYVSEHLQEQTYCSGIFESVRPPLLAPFFRPINCINTNSNSNSNDNDDSNNDNNDDNNDNKIANNYDNNYNYIDHGNYNDNNKNAMKVFINKGSEACVKHMFEKAGNDYGRMRSMYG